MDAATTRARYRIRFMGGDRVQTALREPNRVTTTVLLSVSFERSAVS